MKAMMCVATCLMAVMPASFAIEAFREGSIILGCFHASVALALILMANDHLRSETSHAH